MKVGQILVECSRKYTLFTCFEHIFMKWQEYSGMYFSHECSGNFRSNIYINSEQSSRVESLI